MTRQPTGERPDEESTEVTHTFRSRSVSCQSSLANPQRMSRPLSVHQLLTSGLYPRHTSRRLRNVHVSGAGSTVACRHQLLDSQIASDFLHRTGDTVFENRVVTSRVGACHFWLGLPLLCWSSCPSSFALVAFVLPSRFTTDFAPSVSMFSKFGRSRVGRRNCNSTPDLVQRNSDLFCSPHTQCMQLLIAAALFLNARVQLTAEPLRLVSSTEIQT